MASGSMRSRAALFSEGVRHLAMAGMRSGFIFSQSIPMG